MKHLSSRCCALPGCFQNLTESYNLRKPTEWLFMMGRNIRQHPNQSVQVQLVSHTDPLNDQVVSNKGKKTTQISCHLWQQPWVLWVPWVWNIVHWPIIPLWVLRCICYVLQVALCVLCHYYFQNKGELYKWNRFIFKIFKKSRTKLPAGAWRRVSTATRWATATEMWRPCFCWLEWWWCRFVCPSAHPPSL